MFLGFAEKRQYFPPWFFLKGDILQLHYYLGENRLSSLLLLCTLYAYNYKVGGLNQLKIVGI
jgi:hypothetical protein